jgi:hypothetical protein
MSIGSLGIVGGLAASPLSQRAAATDRADLETADQARQVKGDLKAEQAAGIGQTEEDSQASDRDADGRRPWEMPAGQQPESDPATAAEEAATARPLDPTGEKGGQLDLVG